MTSEVTPSQRVAGAFSPPARKPPSRFIPMNADSDDLAAYGLPPRPDKNALPQRYSQWERLMSLELNFVPPDYEVVEEETTAPLDASEDAESKAPPVDATIRGGDPVASRATSKRWSGAVHKKPPPVDVYIHVEASWTVPGVYPSPDKWKTATTWEAMPSHHRCGSWVGIGGYHSTNHNLLQAGTGMRCSVNADGTLSHETLAWFEWFPDPPIFLTNFKVSPGDIMTVQVDYKGSPAKWIHCGTAVFVNESKATYTSFDYTFDCRERDLEYDFKGDSAEWILERKKFAAFPNYAATFMYNCLATTVEGKEKDLEESKLIDMVQEGRRLSTPVKFRSKTLGLYWGDESYIAHQV